MTRKLILALGLAALPVLALSGTSALAAGTSNYCDPFGGCTSVKLSPGTVKAGKSVTVHGSVGASCRTPATVTLYSGAFKGITSASFRGTPAVYARANRAGAYSKTVTMNRHVKHGSYSVTGRCGGHNFASGKLKVT